MELVYLWVEDYKNIEKQGFNFSPRFKCEYKNNELTIDEKKDYVSIFPDNINVTGIVGKNGSGKSSICGELYSEIKQKELSKVKFSKGFIFIIYDTKYYAITNKKFNCNNIDNDKYFEKFKDLEIKENIVFFSALGEFSTRENHKGGAFVSSKYSILPLQRAALNEAVDTNIQNNILDKINFNYKNISIDLKMKKGNVKFDDIKLGNLSFGEKYRILLFAQLLEKLKVDNNSIVFLDEVTLSLHPMWQREFITDLINLYQNFNTHIIISSHSPFVLSDLPKDNVMFLDTVKLENDETKKKYLNLNIDHLKDGNCINVSKYIKMKPFGANIHTLLSDGFFMSDGLMGEFAKGKIEEIKTFYEKVKKSRNPVRSYLKRYKENIVNFKYIQSIIGEPFLQTIIKNYLDELEQIFENENYKKNQIEKFIEQFGEDEIEKYLESKR